MTKRMIDFALAYAANSLRVHPLVPNTKRPMLDKWQDQATSDPTTVQHWFQQEPNANIGIATGSGLGVIDIDTKNGVNGFAAIQELAAMDKDLPPCPVVQTPTGGQHLWFTIGQELRNVAGVTRAGRGLGQGLDFRGDGGFVVAPPSIIDGRRYRWLNPPRECPTPELPSWAVLRLRPAEVRRQTTTFRNPGKFDPNSNVDRIAGFLGGVQRGSRNPALFWATCEALRTGAPSNVVREAMLSACENNGLIADDGLAAVEKTIESAFNTEKGEIRA